MDDSNDSYSAYIASMYRWGWTMLLSGIAISGLNLWLSEGRHAIVRGVGLGLIVGGLGMLFKGLDYWWERRRRKTD
jgi:hypothetical protein